MSKTERITSAIIVTASAAGIIEMADSHPI